MNSAHKRPNLYQVTYDIKTNEKNGAAHDNNNKTTEN